jgi:hypothetical protein
MNYLKDKYPDQWEEKKRSEKIFYDTHSALPIVKRVCKTKGDQDTKDKVDFMVEFKDISAAGSLRGKTYPWQIKGKHFDGRNGCELLDEITLEYKDVGGHKGSLFGKSYFQSFLIEPPYVFLTCHTQRLQSLAGELCNPSLPVKDVKDSRYRGYTRPDRPLELTTRIRIADIKDNIPYKETPILRGV